MARHPYLPQALRRRVERLPWLERGLWAFEAGFIAMLWAVLRLLGPDRSARVMRAVMTRLGPRLSKSRNIRDNLAIMFPESGPREHAALERRIWGEWGAHFADHAHIDRIYGESDRVELVERVPIETVWGEGRPAVFVAAHLANVTLIALAGTRIGGSGTVLYQRDSNPFVDRMIERRRRHIGFEFVPREGGMRVLIRELSSGKSVGLVVDNRYDEGEPVPFFGLDAPTLTTPARLALRFGCELVPVRIERVTDGLHFRVTLYEPVRPRDLTLGRAEQALDMTRQVNALFEQWIRERPEQWVTTKRRWPRREPAAVPAEPTHEAGDAFLTRA